MTTTASPPRVVLQAENCRIRSVRHEWCVGPVRWFGRLQAEGCRIRSMRHEWCVGPVRWCGGCRQRAAAARAAAAGQCSALASLMPHSLPLQCMVLWHAWFVVYKLAVAVGRLRIRCMGRAGRPWCCGVEAECGDAGNAGGCAAQAAAGAYEPRRQGGQGAWLDHLITTVGTCTPLPPSARRGSDLIENMKLDKRFCLRFITELAWASAETWVLLRVLACCVVLATSYSTRHACMRKQTCTHMHAHKHAHTRNIHAHMHAAMQEHCKNTHMCTYTQMHTHKCTHTHTHTQS